MFDFLLPRETKNLIKINKIGEGINRILYHEYIDEFTKELQSIKTEEHKEKVQLYLIILEGLGKLHTQSLKK